MSAVVVARYDAVGGPASTSMGSDGFEQGPTNEGRFIIAWCGKHSSRRYPDWSKIRWGSRMRETAGGGVQVMHDGRWRDLSDLTRVSADEIRRYHQQLYGTAIVPDRWLFNDFGHLTCYYFEDKNNNKRFDKALERIEGEFIHTTPPDEAATTLGQPVILTESHGCIHVKPTDIDEMQAKGYMAKGVPFIVHDYAARLPGGAVVPDGKKPFEVHFYPGPKKIIVKGVR